MYLFFLVLGLFCVYYLLSQGKQSKFERSRIVQISERREGTTSKLQVVGTRKSVRIFADHVRNGASAFRAALVVCATLCLAALVSATPLCALGTVGIRLP